MRVVAQRNTYVDFVGFDFEKSGDVYFPSASLSERRSIGIDIPGRLGNGGEAKTEESARQRSGPENGAAGNSATPGFFLSNTEHGM